MIGEDNPLYSKSYKFAVRVIRAYEYLIDSKRKKKNPVLATQFLRSGTSIAANITEANGAISKADFSAKISVAYKESLETKLWLNLLKDTDYIDHKTFDSMFSDTDELSKLMYATLKTTRIDAPRRKNSRSEN
jgi:four helix bundle protein